MTRTRSVRFLLQLERLEARDVPSFLPPVRYALAGEPWEVIVADLNHDGRRDVAATLRNSQVAVLLGDGTGQLGAPTYFSVSDFAQGLQARDLNEDGYLDIVTANRESVDPNTGSVSVLFGVGDGTFLPQQQIATGDDGTNQVAVGDMNGDGNLDLATANEFSSDGGAPDTVSILLGNGDGTFQAPIVDVVGTGTGGANDVQIGDLDGDGLQEVTATGYWGSSLSVFYGNGSSANFQAHSAAGHVQADMNKDGHLDVVFGRGTQPSVGLLLNRGDGVFMPATFSPVNSPASAWPVVADFNRDRRLDVAAPSGGSFLNLLLGNGDGTFQTAQSHPSNGLRLGAGLLNTDRFPDLVGRFESHIIVMINDTVWAPPIPPAPEDETVKGALPTGEQLDSRTNAAGMHHAAELTIEPITRATSAIPSRVVFASARKSDVDPAFALFDDKFI